MGGNLQGEPPIPSSVNELVRGRPAQGDTAEDEGAGVKTQRLLAGLALVADKLDHIELLQPTLTDS